MEDENEIKHHFLLENFLLNGNINSFKKMLSLEPNKTIRNQTLNPHKSKQINSIALYKKLWKFNFRKTFRLCRLQRKMFKRKL